jgi:hypothetical protein
MQKLSGSRGRGSRGGRTVSRQQFATVARAVNTPPTACLTTLAPAFGQALVYMRAYCRAMATR